MLSPQCFFRFLLGLMCIKSEVLVPQLKHFGLSASTYMSNEMSKGRQLSWPSTRIWEKEQFFLMFLFPNMNWAREMENHSCYPCIITCSFIQTDQTLETYSCGEKGKKIRTMILKVLMSRVGDKRSNWRIKKMLPTWTHELWSSWLGKGKGVFHCCSWKCLLFYLEFVCFFPATSTYHDFHAST